MQKNKLRWLKKEISSLKEMALFNVPKVLESSTDANILINGKRVINMCSNNYLGLANNTRLKKAAKKAIDTYGVGQSAVRTIAGTTKLHCELEEKLARFKKAEAVITFQSGFVANIAVIPALVNEEDTIFSDELNHASIIDACRLSKAKVVRYQHLNPKDLNLKLKNDKTSGKKLIVTDGVFSMDGDIAPLSDIYKVAQQHNALLMVDDAHGEGVLGTNGRGIVDHFNLHGKVDIEVGTMSKAFGVIGGMVAGKKVIVDWLRQRGRPFLFSSATTPADTAACIEAVNILQEGDKLVKKLWENTNHLKSAISGLGFDIGNSMTPIVPVMLGEADLAKEFSNKLYEKGIFATAITYPTVPQGKARIRVMNSAAHSRNDLNKVVKAFSIVGKETGVI